MKEYRKPLSANSNGGDFSPAPAALAAFAIGAVAGRKAVQALMEHQFNSFSTPKLDPVI